MTTRKSSACMCDSLTAVLSLYFLFPPSFQRYCVNFGGHKECKSEMITDVGASMRKSFEQLFDKVKEKDVVVEKIYGGYLKAAAELKDKGEAVRQ